ncbi:hypothetical protein HJG60_008538 [Phyllostomus discolor]|uniref:Uncharacterized protein n=1 Tax=Phyllostomus discolor TaxID=89673 RepID=A0A834DLI7_9CHIR|nr:hypothetical protein HJG60_008538 [Phyllostomus discolor]
MEEEGEADSHPPQLSGRETPGTFLTVSKACIPMCDLNVGFPEVQFAFLRVQLDECDLYIQPCNHPQFLVGGESCLPEGRRKAFFLLVLQGPWKSDSNNSHRLAEGNKGYSGKGHTAGERVQWGVSQRAWGPTEL